MVLLFGMIMIVAYAREVITFLYILKGGHHFFSFGKGGSYVFVRCFAGSYRPPPVEIMNGPLDIPYTHT